MKFIPDFSTYSFNIWGSREKVRTDINDPTRYDTVKTYVPADTITRFVDPIRSHPWLGVSHNDSYGRIMRNTDEQKAEQLRNTLDSLQRQSPVVTHAPFTPTVSQLCSMPRFPCRPGQRYPATHSDPANPGLETCGSGKLPALVRVLERGDNGQAPGDIEREQYASSHTWANSTLFDRQV